MNMKIHFLIDVDVDVDFSVSVVDLNFKKKHFFFVRCVWCGVCKL